jgi:hypothetical protein
MTLRFGLKESTIRKICKVLSHYPHVEANVRERLPAPKRKRRSLASDFAL